MTVRSARVPGIHSVPDRLGSGDTGLGLTEPTDSQECP